MEVPVFNLSGLNLQLNPLLIKEGQAIRSVNVDGYPFGATTKRPGYIKYLGTPDNSTVKSLFDFQLPSGTQLFLYRVSGSIIYHSIQGTGAWTVSGNGTIANGGHLGHTVLGGTMIVGDGAGSTRHTTNGTSFTNTTAAPISEGWEEYQGRAYASGTASILTYSVSTDITNWSTTGTSDSSSLFIPGAGRNGLPVKLNNRLIQNKTSGLQYRWDGFNLFDTATALGPSSPYSFDKTEDVGFWLNRLGFFSSGGGKPQLISNPIQRQIYNDKGEGIAGTSFNQAPGEVHRYDYFCAVGSVTDDLTDETVPNAIMKYDYQLNDWRNYEFANFPTAMCSFKDVNGVQQFIFGAANGQCYQVSGTAFSDDGAPIASVQQYLIHGNAPHVDKNWKMLRLYFNPSSEARIQIAITNAFYPSALNWVDLGDSGNGYVEYSFPAGSRGRLLFLKIADSSRNTRYSFYGFEYDFDPIPTRK